MHPWNITTDLISFNDNCSSTKYLREKTTPPKNYSGCSWGIIRSLENKFENILLNRNPYWIKYDIINGIGHIKNSTSVSHLCQVYMVTNSILLICSFKGDVRVNGLLLETHVTYIIFFGFNISFFEYNELRIEHHYRIVPTSPIQNVPISDIVSRYYRWDVISGRPETHVSSPIKYLTLLEKNYPVYALKSHNTRYLQHIMPLTFNKFLIGRSKLCSVTVAHKFISRMHCSICIEKGIISLKNLRLLFLSYFHLRGGGMFEIHITCF